MSDAEPPDPLHQSLNDFGRALDRLAEVLAVGESNPLALDAGTQRFEFTFALAWKSLRRALQEEHGFGAVSPKQTLQKAYAVGWIDDEKQWLAMLDDRNKTSHTYKEEVAREIFAHVNGYYPEMRRMHAFLVDRFGRLP